MFFSAKLASVLLAVVASAQAAVTVRSSLAELSVVIYDDTDFRGSAFSPSPLGTGTCFTLPNEWRDRAQSLTITSGYSCTFFTGSGCEGTSRALSGSVSTLPDPPLYDNIESLFCLKSIF